MKFGISGCLCIFDRVSVANAEFIKFVLQDGRFLFLEEETTSVLLMLTFMTLALHSHKDDCGIENCHAVGGVFLEKEIIIFQSEQSRKCNCIKLAIKNF